MQYNNIGSGNVLPFQLCDKLLIKADTGGSHLSIHLWISLGTDSSVHKVHQDGGELNTYEDLSRGAEVRSGHLVTE
jgi:hypothetical protein